MKPWDVTLNLLSIMFFFAVYMSIFLKYYAKMKYFYQKLAFASILFQKSIDISEAEE